MSSDIPKSIRLALAHTGLKLKAVAVKAEIDADSLSKVKNGKRGVTIQKLDSIAYGFGMEAWELLKLGSTNKGESK